jgi:hypothetical protein
MNLDEFYAICDAIEPYDDGCMDPPGAYAGASNQVCIDGKRFKMHRLALERKLGRPIKPGYLACHTCDWKSCVNPDHLYEGTYSDNQRDRVQRDPESYDNFKLGLVEWRATPKGRETMSQISKDNWKKNPEWRHKVASKGGGAFWEKYRNDPEFRARMIEARKRRDCHE